MMIAYLTEEELRDFVAKNTPSWEYVARQLKESIAKENEELIKKLEARDSKAAAQLRESLAQENEEVVNKLKAQHSQYSYLRNSSELSFSNTLLREDDGADWRVLVIKNSGSSYGHELRNFVVDEWKKKLKENQQKVCSMVWRCFN